MIDHILGLTKQLQIIYIGYSLGNTQMFSALANNASGIQSKLSLFVSIAPLVQLNYSTDPIITSISSDVDKIQWWMNFFDIDVMFGPTW